MLPLGNICQLKINYVIIITYIIVIIIIIIIIVIIKVFRIFSEYKHMIQQFVEVLYCIS